MNERELLEMVSERAPVAGPGYIDAVIRTARRARSRRRIAKLASVPAVIVIVAAGAGAITQRPHQGRRGPEPRGYLAPAAAAAPYAAAIRIEVASDSSSRPPVLYIVDHTCAGVAITPPALGCKGRSLSRVVRKELAAELSGYARVHFVHSDGPGVRDRHGTVRNGGYLIILGPIRLAGTQADVPIAIERTLLDGRGDTVVMIKRDGWWITDPRRRGTATAWIS
jgi:hypothetical protein